MNRQFYCSDDLSTFSISYQYVYCKANLASSFTSALTITVGSASESYEWYDKEGLTNLPANASLYGGSNFDKVSDSNMFGCNTTTNSNRAGSSESESINAITISYEYNASKVNSTDSILVHIYNFLDNHNYWFMIGDVQIRCLGMLFDLFSSLFCFVSIVDSVPWYCLCL